MKKPFAEVIRKDPKNGLCCLWTCRALLVAFLSCYTFSPIPAWGIADGATEALEMRYNAEMAILAERHAGHRQLASAMEQALPELLGEYLATRDGTIALDTVDAAFVQEQFKVARAMEEPGVALALDVFSGPGTGYENELRTAITNLADYHADFPARAAEHDVRQRGEREHLPEVTLRMHEKEMERQMEKIERQIEQTRAPTERFDAKFDAKLDAKLDAAAHRFEFKTSPTEIKAAHVAEVAKSMAETDPEMAERLNKRAEKLMEKVEEKAAEKAEEKVEKVAEQVEKVPEIAEKAAEKELTRSERAAEAQAAKDVQDAVDRSAAAERAEAGAKMKAEQEVQRQADLERAAERAEAGAKMKAEQEAKEAAKPKR